MKIWHTKTFKVCSWILVLCYMGGIFYLSSIQTVNLPPLFPHFDKFLHFHLYLGLAFLITNALPGTHARKRFLLAFFIASLYGVSDEIHQYFVPPRECSVYDWIADALGAWVGAWLYLKSESIWRKH